MAGVGFKVIMYPTNVNIRTLAAFLVSVGIQISPSCQHQLSIPLHGAGAEPTSLPFGDGRGCTFQHNFYLPALNFTNDYRRFKSWAANTFTDPFIFVQTI